MKTLRISAPAKVNLRLEITGRRTDGYHEIATLFHAISLCDELTFTSTPGTAISISSDNPAIPTGPSNLAYTAASLLLAELNCNPGLSIHIQKNIPVGAGLGGGSSDAAATLIGISRLLNVRMSPEDLHRIAIRIGADVPFFLLPTSTAFATGIGDALQPLTLAGTLWFIIIFPGVFISTAWAYRTFSEYNALTNIPKNISIFGSIRNLHDCIPGLHNDFERIVFQEYSEVQAAKNMLVAAGASGALMSGSGSAVFGVFTSRSARDSALRALKRTDGHTYFAAHSFQTGSALKMV